MKLEKLVLILVIIGAALYAGALLIGVTVATPLGVSIPIVLVAAVCGYILWRVIKERLGNAEDDHYDRNVER